MKTHFGVGLRAAFCCSVALLLSSCTSAEYSRQGRFSVLAGLAQELRLSDPEISEIERIVAADGALKITRVQRLDTSRLRLFAEESGERPSKYEYLLVHTDGRWRADEDGSSVTLAPFDMD